MLTQAEADHLISMPKRVEAPSKLKFPIPGDHKEIDILSSDGKVRFILDVNRGRIRISKCTYQNRMIMIIVFVQALRMRFFSTMLIQFFGLKGKNQLANWRYKNMICLTEVNSPCPPTPVNPALKP